MIHVLSRFISTVYYLLPMKLREGNVFCLLTICLFTGEFHVTITHDALGLTIQGSSPWSCPPSVQEPPMPWAQSSLFTGTFPGGQDLRPVQTCSLASYWNAFLFGRKIPLDVRGIEPLTLVSWI